MRPLFGSVFLQTSLAGRLSTRVRAQSCWLEDENDRYRDAFCDQPPGPPQVRLHGRCRRMVPLHGARAMQAAAAPAKGAKLVLLGTKLVLLGTKGGPRLGGNRANPANALIVHGDAYVIDTGMAVTAQIVKAGIAFKSIRSVFISHMHSDHQLEFGNLLYNMWAAGALRSRVSAYGPAGLEAMAADYWRLNRLDIATRMEDEGRPEPSKLLIPHDIARAGGAVMQDGRVKVIALNTPHPPLGTFAYRFETAYRSVVYSVILPSIPSLATSPTVPTCWCTRRSSSPASTPW